MAGILCAGNRPQITNPQWNTATSFHRDPNDRFKVQYLSNSVNGIALLNESIYIYGHAFTDWLKRLIGQNYFLIITHR